MQKRHDYSFSLHENTLNINVEKLREQLLSSDRKMMVMKQQLAK